MSNFNGEDYDFAAGAIKGLRSWNIDDQGRLRGVTHPAIWKPGENVAVCKSPGRYVRCPKSSTHDPYAFRYSFVGEPTCDDPSCTPRGHLVVPERAHTFDPSCECGFWAYDEHNFTEHGQIVGVIEGYGRTTIGTKGFRCEKARIVALCTEAIDDQADLTLSVRMRLAHLYPEVRIYADYDEMVSDHGALLKVWDAPGEDFWEDKPSAALSAYSAAAASYGSQLTAIQAAINRYSAPPSRWTLGKWSS